MHRFLPFAFVLALVASLAGAGAASAASQADLDATAVLGAAFLPPEQAATVVPGPLTAGGVTYAAGVSPLFGNGPLVQRITYSLAVPGRSGGTISPYAGPKGGTTTLLGLAPDAATAQSWVTRMITSDDPVPVATATQVGDISRQFSGTLMGTNDRGCYVRFAVGRAFAQLGYDVGYQQADCSADQQAKALALAALQAPLLAAAGAAATPAPVIPPVVANILPVGTPTGGTPLGYSVQPSTAVAVDTVGSLVWTSHRRSYSRLAARLKGVAAQSASYQWNMHPWVLTGTFIPFATGSQAESFVRLQSQLAGNGMTAALPQSTAYYAYDNGKSGTLNAYATIWVAAGARVAVFTCTNALGAVPGDPVPSIGKCGRQARIFATRWSSQ